MLTVALIAMHRRSNQSCEWSLDTVAEHRQCRNALVADPLNSFDAGKTEDVLVLYLTAIT